MSSIQEAKIKWEPVIRHQVAIIGKVMNAETKQGMTGVLVELTLVPPQFKKYLNLKAIQSGNNWEKMLPRLDKTQTTGEGYYYFQDLPAGYYQLTAYLPNSGTRYASITSEIIKVFTDNQKLEFSYINLLLPTTGIKGKIIAPKNEKFMAKVQIQGQNNYAFTNTEGEYLLTGVEAGSFPLVISAPGYELDISQGANPPQISLKPGEVLSQQNFTLKRKSFSNGMVKNGVS